MAPLVCGALVMLAVLTAGLRGRGARRRLRALRRPRTGNGRPPVPGPLVLDLVAAALQAGAPVAGTLRLVADAMDEATDGPAAGPGLQPGVEPGAGRDAGILRSRARQHDLGLPSRPEGGPGWAVALDRALDLARDAGVAPGALLASAATDERNRLTARRRVAAARLGVRVVVPTGLCLLPAFVLLTVVPLVLALLGAG